MISFCQDLSISYQYHIYENKTIKKITHSRNGSNISQKTLVKSSKLSVVSKQFSNSKLAGHKRGISLSDSDKNVPQRPIHKPNHERTTSNILEANVMQTPRKSQPFHQTAQQQPSFRFFQQGKSTQLHQKPLQPRAYFNKSQNIINLNPQEKPRLFLNQPPVLPQKGYVQSCKYVPNYFSPFKTRQTQQSQTIRINSSIQKLDESIETKKYNYEQNSAIMQNKSCANSLASYQTLAKFKQDENVSFSLSNNDGNQHKRIRQKVFGGMDFSTPRDTKIVFQDRLFNPQASEITKIRNSPLSHHNTLLPQQKHSNNDHSILFDAQSIVSQNLRDQLQSQFDDQSLSVVQQRNFFFQKEEHSSRAFKKSIEKFIFFEAGHVAGDRRWVLFKNVQEKENKKLYSIKEFSGQHEKEYFNEYEVYLELKNETSQQVLQRSQQSFHHPNNNQCVVFLQLFNALSNNQQKKLHLVKQPFKHLLNDEIYHIKIKNTLSIDRLRVLLGEKTKLQKEIKEIFEFFSNKDVYIRENQVLEIEDFVVCQGVGGKVVVKFQSLFKMEKGEKMPKVLKRQSVFIKEKMTLKKLDQLHNKIHSAFFFE